MNWELSSIILFSLISIVLLLVGWFLTRFVEAYPVVKAQLEAENIKRDPPEYMKHLPESMREDGSVKFTHHAEESIGTHDGEPIYKFYIDDHGTYWTFDGVADPKTYSQMHNDPIVRVFIGKCMYTPKKTTQSDK